MSTRYDRMHAYDEPSRGAGVIYVLMLVIAVCFGGFLWQLYSGPDAPHISAPAGPYKVQPPPEGSDALDSTEQTLAEAAASQSSEELAPAESAPIASEQQTGPPQVAAAPTFAASGPYVAQLAALQSEAAVQQAWRRLSSRAPDLFAAAHLDVERADLGQRGIYYRVRAGYFTDRPNAARFCDRIRQMGQDCIVTTR